MARYNDEFRAQAIVMLEAAGWPDSKGAIMRVARQLGIKHQTLSRWSRAEQNPPPHKVVRIKTFDLRQAVRDELQAILLEMPDARPDADFKELATAFGILVDKLQLLDGKATERVEILTPEERTDRLTELLDTSRARRDGCADSIIQ